MAVGTYVGSFTKATATGNQDITLPTGCPDLTAAAAGSWAIIFWQAGSNLASGSWNSVIRSGLGFVANGGGTISEFAVGTFSEDAVATANTSRRMAAKCITLPNAAGSGVDWEAGFVSFPTSTTMRINWSTNVGNTDVICFTVLTGLTGAKVLSWTRPTATGNAAVTGAGFSPDLVLHAGAANASPQSLVNNLFALGAMNKHGQQWSNSILSADAVNPSNTSRWQQTDAAFCDVVTNEGADQQTHFTSMDADGFTMNWSTANGTIAQVASLCLGGVSSKLGAFVKNQSAAAATQVVGSRHGFTVRGAMFSDINAAPTGAPATAGYWELGMTDGTNSRAARLFDNDNVTPTKAKSIWISDGIGVVDWDNTPTTLAKMAWTSATTADFTVNYPTNNSVVPEILYLLLGDAGSAVFPAAVGV